MTYGVLTPVGATFRKLIVQEEIVVVDNAIEISKVNGLIESLSTKQGTIGNILTFSSDLFRISAEGNIFTIQCLIDGVYGNIMSIQHNNGVSRMSVFGELRPTSINGLSSLDLLDTLRATQVLASNLYTKTET